MTIFRRAAAGPPPRRSTCPQCAWFSYRASETLDHLLAAHINRRLAEVEPNPGRRITDGQSPWVLRNLAASDAGQGLAGRRLS